jgi:hypothetical protein
MLHWPAPLFLWLRSALILTQRPQARQAEARITRRKLSLRKTVSAKSRYPIPSTSISTPAVTNATTVCMYCGIPGVVCSAIAVQTMSMSCSEILCWLRKARAVFAPSTSNRSVLLLYRRVNPISWNIAPKQSNSGSYFKPPFFPQAREVIHASRVVEQQRRLSVTHQLRCFSNKFTIGDRHARDRACFYGVYCCGGHIRITFQFQRKGFSIETPGHR